MLPPSLVRTICNRLDLHVHQLLTIREGLTFVPFSTEAYYSADASISRRTSSQEKQEFVMHLLDLENPEDYIDRLLSYEEYQE